MVLMEVSELLAHIPDQLGMGGQVMAREAAMKSRFYPLKLTKVPIPTMRVWEVLPIQTSRYGPKKRKCWSQIALDPMGGNGVSTPII